MAQPKFTDEWFEQKVRCRVYPKKGQRDVPEYVECYVSKSLRFTVFIKAGEDARQAAMGHRRFRELAAHAAGEISFG